MTTTRARFLTLATALLFGVPAIAQSSKTTARPAPTASVTGIQLNFKRDPRLVDPFRGMGPWVEGSKYTGATAQDTVEVRAAGVGPAGKPTKINPEWSASDPEMVTVSPNQGDDVKVVVHKAGESKLKITYQGVSKELVIRAKYSGKFILFEISPLTIVQPTGPTAKEMSPLLKDQGQQISYAAG